MLCRRENACRLLVLGLTLAAVAAGSVALPPPRLTQVDCAESSESERPEKSESKQGAEEQAAAVRLPEHRKTCLRAGTRSRLPLPQGASSYRSPPRAWEGHRLPNGACAPLLI